MTILVPDRVALEAVLGAYVVDEAARARLLGLGFSRPVAIEPVLFFRKAGA